MFDRFTDRARQVMGLARREAVRFGHDYIGTEHVLLGLIQEGSGVAADVLNCLDVDPKEVRERTEKLVSPGADPVTAGQLPFTMRAKKVLEFSLEEATTLGHNYIGTEHLLLGLIREQGGIAAAVLADLGVELDAARKEIQELLGLEAGDRTRFSSSPGGDRVESDAFLIRVLNRIGDLEERVRRLEGKSGDE